MIYIGLPSILRLNLNLFCKTSQKVYDEDPF